MKYFLKSFNKLNLINFKVIVFFIPFLTLFNHVSYAQKLDKSSDLIKLYREYRIVQTKKTDWIDSVDNWAGKFHKIMSEVSDTLGKPIYKKKDIINLLGNPDKIINKNNQSIENEIYVQINNKSIKRIDRREEYLIYKWRGYRDFIYFYIKCNVVQKSDWYYSWE